MLFFCPRVQAVVHKTDDGRLVLNTKRLERSPGDMLRDAAAVFAGAEATVAETQQRQDEQRRKVSSMERHSSVNVELLLVPIFKLAVNK